MLTFRSFQSCMRLRDWEDVGRVREYMVKSEGKREGLVEQREELRQRKAKLQAEVATKKALSKLNMRQKVAYEREIERLQHFPRSMDAAEQWKELGNLRATQLHLQTSVPPLTPFPDLHSFPPTWNFPQVPILPHTDSIEVAIDKTRAVSAALTVTLEATQLSRTQDIQTILKLRRRLEAEVLKSLRAPAAKAIERS